MAEVVYILCALTSLACAVLLIRGYRRSRSRLLLWSCLGFVALAANNVLLFVDLVVVPHALEFSENPHQVLREVARILVPEAQVVISCFNPWSLWGVRRAFGSKTQYPWNGRFINLPRLKDWLNNVPLVTIWALKALVKPSKKVPSSES